MELDTSRTWLGSGLLDRALVIMLAAELKNFAITCHLTLLYKGINVQDESVCSVVWVVV